MPSPQPLPACTFIIFGGTGDLAKRKLFPALFRLHEQGRLHRKTRILATGRNPMTVTNLLSGVKRALRPKARAWSAFVNRIAYQELEFGTGPAYAALKARIEAVERRTGTQNRLFYLATPPETFQSIVEHLERERIAERSPAHRFHRIIFEKPFGRDLSSARALNGIVTRLFDERQIYRIDHYLGKSFVNEILVLRFANRVFEDLWDAQHIERVGITVSETHGVERRGRYYDNAGALRDMVQNHLLQLLALTAMEAPATMDASDIHDEKVKVLRAVTLEPPQALRKSMIIGQYAAGTADGKRIPAYRDEDGVRKSSTTETFVSVRLAVHNKRWAGVPFILRTGKALAEGFAQVDIVFKQSPCILFCGPDGELSPNKLTIRIQPDEGVRMQFNLAERTGDTIVKPHDMGFYHHVEFGYNTPEAYEVLLAEAMRGDQTLFTRWDEVEHAWRIADHLRSVKAPLLFYKAGSDGPPSKGLSS